VIDGDTTVTGGSLAVGAVAVGAVVGVAISEADNTATLNLSQSDMDIGAVTVNAGLPEKPNNNQAVVLGVTGSAAAGAVGINVAYARNSVFNRALILGDTDGALEAGSIRIQAEGLGRAYSVLFSAAAAGANVLVSVAVPYLTNVQEARMDSAS